MLERLLVLTEFLAFAFALSDIVIDRADHILHTFDHELYKITSSLARVTLIEPPFSAGTPPANATPVFRYDILIIFILGIITLL